jgi:hypothetical protein
MMIDQGGGLLLACGRQASLPPRIAGFRAKKKPIHKTITETYNTFRFLTAEAHEDRQTRNARLGVDEPRVAKEAAPVAFGQIRAEADQA